MDVNFLDIVVLLSYGFVNVDLVIVWATATDDRFYWTSGKLLRESGPEVKIRGGQGRQICGNEKAPSEVAGAQVKVR